MNFGDPEYVTAKKPVEIVAEASGKRINVEWVKGPVGVQSRNRGNERICLTGWRARVSTLGGIQHTCPLIEAQVRKATRQK